MVSRSRSGGVDPVGQGRRRCRAIGKASVPRPALRAYLTVVWHTQRHAQNLRKVVVRHRHNNNKQQNSPRNQIKIKMTAFFSISINKVQTKYTPSWDHKLHDKSPLPLAIARAENGYPPVGYSTIEGWDAQGDALLISLYCLLIVSEQLEGDITQTSLGSELPPAQ